MIATPPAEPIAIRDAIASDAPALAQLAVIAAHGIMDLFYAGLVPDKSVADLIIERRLLQPGGFCSLPRWRIAWERTGRILGALNSLPYDDFARTVSDPLIPPERYAPLDGLTELEASAKGCYHVNMIAVFPVARKLGIGRALMREAQDLAQRAGFSRLSLVTFEADADLVRFYRNCGFEVVDSRPVTPHPALELGGNWALMMKDLQLATGL